MKRNIFVLKNPLNAKEDDKVADEFNRTSNSQGPKVVGEEFNALGICLSPLMLLFAYSLSLLTFGEEDGCSK